MNLKLLLCRNCHIKWCCAHSSLNNFAFPLMPQCFLPIPWKPVSIALKINQCVAPSRDPINACVLHEVHRVQFQLFPKCCMLLVLCTLGKRIDLSE